ncbi:hypothetical protein RUM43_008765 [Polyplax serrata]|uniref:C2H2-type domain-containing protein n=1 Tax=Polyplax serrata TaxID=468196 RepID=A0AAN8P6E3_POLSC
MCIDRTDLTFERISGEQTNLISDWVVIPGRGLLRKCPICRKTFAQSTSMKRHIQATHIKNSAATCNICGKICKNKYTMWVHRSKKHRPTALLRRFLEEDELQANLESDSK